MDKNTIIGLGLIGAILVTFTLMNKPSEEEIKKQREQAEKEKKELALEKEKEAEEKKQLKLQKKTKQISDTVSKTNDFKAETIKLESDKLIIEVSTLGGNVSAAYLKGYKSYNSFKNNSNKPLLLFKEKDAELDLAFDYNGVKKHTKNLGFEVLKKSKKRLSLVWTPEEGKEIVYTYQLKDGKYDLDFSIANEGINLAKNEFTWKADLKQTERLLSEQKRVSTVCYKYKNEDYSYLSEMADDEINLEKPTEWIAYKQSYFSTILQPEKPFLNSKAKVKVRNFKQGDDKFYSHIKTYYTKTKLDLKGENDAIKFSWYFGPNDYEHLAAYKSSYEDIINFGWGLFRWINIYAIQPIFNVLAGTGLGFGIVILILTLVIKLFLTPIQWKMYVSTAKMKILKPEIEALTAKYPKKEDAMKKQMEQMTLYRESGASPLAGCLPMLIQMPILLAVFRFFPAAFELRQQSFLWAEDLSSYDSIFSFNFYIPFYGDHISLFTLLMAGTTLIYTHMNSGNMQQPQQPGMPNMKVLMYIFPVMMIFFFNNYSSGLSYYYFISTLISIIIMMAIKKFFVDEEKLKEKMAARKANAKSTTKKKSKFQERLEQMQKMQQERLKGKK